METETKIELNAPQPDAITEPDVPAAGIALAPAPAISIAPAAAPELTSATQPTITRATRRPRRAAPQLTIWQPSNVETAAGALGKPLAELVKQGVLNVLFLEMVPQTEPLSAKAPVFTAKAAIGGPEHTALWSGLTWDAAQAPELWNLFALRPYVELAPAGAQPAQIPEQNALRLAFGAGKTDWLTLVRLGTAEKCTGIVAFFSGNSLRAALPAVIPLFAGAVPKAA